MTVVVELFAGLAALSNFVLGGLKPPCSRLGSKAGYAHAIAREMGLTEPPTQVLLVDADRSLCNALSELFHSPASLAAKVALMVAREPDARACWDSAKLEKDDSAAAYWLYTAARYRGVGNYRGIHSKRPNCDGGFSPCRTELARRIASRPVLKQVSVLCSNAMDIETFPNAFVYLDCPYEDTAGYDAKSSFDLKKLANDWVGAGSRVAVSEAKVIDLGPRFWHKEVTHERKGQTRKDSRSITEWLHISK